MPHRGYVRMYRNTVDSPVWSSPFYLKLWMFCMFEASHEERTQMIGNKDVKLDVGQFVTGIKSLEKKLNDGSVCSADMLSGKSWWRRLSVLENMGMVSIKKTTKYSVVTVIGWGEQQSGVPQLGNKRETNGKQVGTNNHYNHLNHLNHLKKEIVEIVTYLNSVSKKNYRPSTEKTQQLINARLKEGFTVNDFKTVIDIKTDEWLNDKKFNKFLRPETLFSNKFESYLNQTSDVENTGTVSEPQNVFDADSLLED